MWDNFYTDFPNSDLSWPQEQRTLLGEPNTVDLRYKEINSQGLKLHFALTKVLL